MSGRPQRTVDGVPGLAAILAAEVLDLGTAEQYVSWAQDALGSGFDTPSILRLAIEEPPYFTPDLRRLFHAALAELDVESITSEQAMVLYGQQLARSISTGDMSPREGARLMASLFPSHIAPKILSEWWRLDEAYDCDYCRAGVLQNHASLEEAIVAEARRLEQTNWRAA